MSAGCFSWCHRPRRDAITKMVKVTEPVHVEMELGSDKIVTPTSTQYIMASGKQVLDILRTASRVIPVPLLQDAIGIAMKIIQLCEGATAVQQKVKELQERVGHLMVVIVENVTMRYEEGSEAVVKAVEGIEKDVKDLLSTLTTVSKELMEIRKQGEWLQGLYANLNMDAIERCLNQLSAAQERFKLANDLRGANLLLELHTRLNKISRQLDDVHKDVKHVAEDIKNVVDKVENISTYLRSGTLISSATVVRHRMPLKPGIFHGRDDLVDEIARLLVKQETAHVCLLGPGGMGKTSVLLAVVEQPLIKQRFPGGNCVWVPCIEASSATLLLEILYLQLQVPGDKQVTLEKILSHINTLDQPRLLLLDNFETPWNVSGTQKQIEDILRQLAELNQIAIFITMRGMNPPCDDAIQWKSRNIQPTDEEACFRIYHDIDPSSKGDPDVGRLLAVLGYMPFAVTLMAKLGKEGMSKAKELLEAWLESGPDLLSDSPEQSMNRSISLSVESDLVKRNPNAITLLSILSLLPAGTTKQNLHWWAMDSALKTPMIPSAIAALSKAALLIENKHQNSDSPVLFVIPVVQSFMQQHGRIEERIQKQIQSSCCQYILDHACRYGDPAFPVNSKALAAEDPNIQSIFFASPDSLPSNRTIEALISFSWYRSDTTPDLEIVKHAVKAAKASGVRNYIVSAVWCLGWAYRQLGDFLPSHNSLQEAYLLSDDPSGGVELQRFHCRCGIDLVEAADMVFDDKIDVISLAEDVASQCAVLSDDCVHGLSLVRLAAVLCANRQQQEALVHLNNARIMLEAVGNTPYLADAYQATARVHFRERRLPEALDAIQVACKLVEGPDIPIYLESSLIHFSADRDIEAWKHIEIALMEASRVGDRFSVARALELMGYGYLRRGDYDNAYGAYEAAGEKFLGTVDDLEEICKENMTRIKEKQSNPGAKLGFHRPRNAIEISFFYPESCT